MSRVCIFKTDREYWFSINKGVELDEPFLKIKDGWLIIPKGYSWDGCTPKFRVGKFIIGTPDGSIGWDGKPRCFAASMVHDALYQYKSTSPLTRKEADLLFYNLLVSRKFKMAKTYYRAVRIFGRFLGKWKVE